MLRSCRYKKREYVLHVVLYCALLVFSFICLQQSASIQRRPSPTKFTASLLSLTSTGVLSSSRGMTFGGAQVVTLNTPAYSTLTDGSRNLRTRGERTTGPDGSRNLCSRALSSKGSHVRQSHRGVTNKPRSSWIVERPLLTRP